MRRYREIAYPIFFYVPFVLIIALSLAVGFKIVIARKKRAELLGKMFEEMNKDVSVSLLSYIHNCGVLRCLKLTLCLYCGNVLVLDDAGYCACSTAFFSVHATFVPHVMRSTTLSWWRVNHLCSQGFSAKYLGFKDPHVKRFA